MEIETHYETVHHPAHYTSNPALCECGSGIECIQVAEHMSFNLGNATKYIWRAGQKGPAAEDLHKAIWYIHREIHRLSLKEARAIHANY